MLKILKYCVFIFLLLLTLRTIVGDILLKRNGICRRAVLVNEIADVRYHKKMLRYQLEVNGKLYKNASYVYDLTRYGDSVCVVYLSDFPLINRAVRYFDKGDTNCGCK